MEETNSIESTKQELLEAINTFATHVDANFAELKADINGIKSSMVTKSYLDEKLASSYGDAVVMVRKEDAKVDNLTGILAKKKFLSKIEVKEVMHVGPFPKA